MLAAPGATMGKFLDPSLELSGDSCFEVDVTNRHTRLNSASQLSTGFGFVPRQLLKELAIGTLTRFQLMG
jgi:hypothetical protein